MMLSFMATKRTKSKGFRQLTIFHIRNEKKSGGGSCLTLACDIITGDINLLLTEREGREWGILERGFRSKD